MPTLIDRIAQDLDLPPRGVAAVTRLLKEGATVPFIARYRKEATGGLDEVQIRDIAERQEYLVALDDRRTAILRSIDEQGLLTDTIRQRLAACVTKTELEDVYLPFKPKRRTKAMIAREQGLQPLAANILEQGTGGDLEADARSFVDPAKGIASIEQAIAGARDIVIETVAENVEVRAFLRRVLAEHGVVRSQGIKSKIKGRTKFEDYYDYREAMGRVPSHRYLALCRGESKGVLRVHVETDDERAVDRIERIMGLSPRSPYRLALASAIAEAYKKRLLPGLGKEVRAQVAARAEREAVEVFADNLKNLLLSAPFGSRPILAIDPGIRTGSKCVVLDRSGRFLETVTIFPQRGKEEEKKAERTLEKLIERHRPEAIAVGNGTGGRETERLARGVVKSVGVAIPVISVNEAGASVYSASDIARQEFPDLDITVRGAVSIGRRLQDPLAELVKIDPKSIGVGQYQHDVDQGLLSRKLHDVVESCVNAVGVELGTASAPLLSYVAGIGPQVAEAIVAHRAATGAFPSRRALLKVKGLGPKAFEQCAGFLRIRDGKEPLDASAVHPERYGLVGQMAKDVGVSVAAMVGNAAILRRIDLSRYVAGDVGEPTLRDILGELEKPGRDPRETFEGPRFSDDVQELEDLKEGMVLEGVVTNVAAFGAFVDLGVHQDGLVHISQLANRFVKDPGDEVKVGDRVQVRVLGIDLERRRISLTRKSV